MSISQSLIKTFNTVATGSDSEKKKYTVMGGLFFLTVTTLFVIIPLILNNIFDIQPFIDRPEKYYFSVPLMVIGLILIIWTNLVFRKVKGTPVPFNPPPKLVTSGPFAYARNPMTTGLFILMFGIGFHAGSALSVFVFTPLYIILHVIELKYVEEPEIEKRLGQEYIEYKKSVPMVFPYKGKYRPGK